MESKCILVAVVGTSPQVVSETLYVLSAERNLQIDEVHLIGTTQSKRSIEAVLLHPSTGALARLSAICRVPAHAQVHVIEGADGSQLDDIRTPADNQAAARFILNVVARVARTNPAVLFGSVAGGRKTMGNYLQLAFELFARPMDQLFHVLTTPAAEKDRDFVFPELGREHKIELAEIPFIRLHGLLQTHLQGIDNLDRVLEHVQARVDGRPSLRFVGEDRVMVGGKEIAVTPGDMQLWLEAARRRKACEAKSAVGCDCCFARPDSFRKFLFITPKSARHMRELPEPEKAALTERRFMSAASRIKKKLMEAAIPPNVVDLVRISEVEARGKKRYGVRLEVASIHID